MPTFDVTVGANRTLSLPKELCERLDIVEGSRVEFFLTVDGQVHFHAITQGAGTLGRFAIDRRRPPLSIREMDDGIGEYMREKEDRLRRQREAGRGGEASRSAAE